MIFMQTKSSPDKELHLERVSFGFVREKILISDLSFSLKGGQVLALQGSNGVGKSTLLKLCLGLHPTLSGSLKNSFLPHDFEFLPQMQNITIHLPLTLEDVIRAALPRGLSKTVIQSKGLLHEGDLQKEWNCASGGERQKALLTRTFLSPKSLLVLDEPFNHLDEESLKLAQREIEGSRSAGKALLLVSHQGCDGFPCINIDLHAKKDNKAC